MEDREGEEEVGALNQENTRTNRNSGMDILNLQVIFFSFSLCLKKI